MYTLLPTDSRTGHETAVSGTLSTYSIQPTPGHIEPHHSRQTAPCNACNFAACRPETWEDVAPKDTEEQRAEALDQLSAHLVRYAIP